EEMGRDLSRWGDKDYDRVTGRRNPIELALNYRMSEPQAAVAAAQMTRLTEIVSARRRAGDRLTEQLEDTPGIRLPKARSGDEMTYWFSFARVDQDRLRVTRDELAKEFVAEGVPADRGIAPGVVYQF